MKCVISSWLGKNMIPLLRHGNLEHFGSSLEQASLACAVVESPPLALTKVVNSYGAPCLTWQDWVTPFVSSVPLWSVYLSCSFALKFSDLPVASLLFSQVGTDTKKWWWMVALRAARELQMWAECEKDMTEQGIGQPVFLKEFIQCSVKLSRSLLWMLQLVPSLGHP